MTTARVGVSRSLSEAYLSLQHNGVDLDNENAVTVKKLGRATCRNAMLVAQAHHQTSSQQPPEATMMAAASTSSIYLEPVSVATGCIVSFTLRPPGTANYTKKRWWRRRRKRPADMFAYAAFEPQPPP